MDCPNCGAKLLENGCEECEHKTDGTDCMCYACNRRLYDFAKLHSINLGQLGLDAIMSGEAGPQEFSHFKGTLPQCDAEPRAAETNHAHTK